VTCDYFDIDKLPICPDWLSEEAQQTLSKGYLLPGETPRDMWKRCALTAEKHLKKPGIGEDIMEMFWLGYMGGATPVLSNFGTNRGLPVSCYSHTIRDDTINIFSHLKEVAALSKYGGGVGSYFGELRPGGSPISKGGKSGSIVDWMRLYDRTAATVSQGNTRRGSFALYLPIDHPDLMDALRSKDHSQGDPRNFIDSNLAVTIKNSWIEEMLAGDKEKQKIFSEVLKSRMVCGSPYLMFPDNANDQAPDCFKKRNLEIVTSNLCFTGDTLVSLANGKSPARIDSLIGEKFDVNCASKDEVTGLWSSDTQSGVAFKTGTKEVIKVELSDGSTFRCTDTHRLGLATGGWIEAKDSIGHQIDSWQTEQPLEVVRITPDGVEDVYNLTVEENHNYYIITNKEFGSGILVSNCSEIFLPTDENHSFTCVLSSINLSKYDEWKDWRGKNTGKTLPELGIYFLDAIVEEFIHKASRLPAMGRTVRFTKKSRSLGLGTMGLHALYQSRGLTFASEEARELNIEVHKYIDEMSLKASQDMAKEYGEPEWCEGHGIRHATRLAIAPTKTNSVICGAVSEGIEPLIANLFVAGNAKGTFVRRNPYLEKHLAEIGKNDQEVWDSILEERGSVQHLDFLSPRAKEIFKTAREIDQFEIVKQAADRQRYICQGQSVNLFVDPEADAAYLMRLHLSAWKMGLKSLYYLKSTSLQVKNRGSKVVPQKQVAKVVTKPDCPWCTKVKELLRSRGYEITEVDRSEVPDSDWSWDTVPQVWINGSHVEGGYEGVSKMLGQSEGEKYSECLACQG